MKARVLAACAVALLLLTGFRAPPEGTYEGLGSEAPDAVLSDLDGKTLRLSEGAGSWSLLKFGTTWCPRCSEEVNELNKLAPELQKANVRVVEIFLRESAETVRSDLKAHPRTYRPQILVDSRGATIPAFGLSVIPRLFLVDPKGVVRLDSQFQEAEKLRASLQRALRGR